MLSGNRSSAPASGVRVFFAEPMAIPPPPPPPLPPLAPLRNGLRPRPSSPALTAPVETPESVVPEQAIEPGAPGGEPGASKGALPGGVVGAIVGGLPEAPASPPPPCGWEPVFASRRRSSTSTPSIPRSRREPWSRATSIVELQVNTQGRVTDARVVKGNQLLKDAALAAVRQWVYTPTLKDGVPVRLIMTVTVHFKLS